MANLTNTGFARFATLAGGDFKYMALGTDDTAFSASDTALGSEITDSGLARTSGTVSYVTTNVTNDTMQITHQWTATATKTVAESGIFNASSGGTMPVRIVESPSRTLYNGDKFTKTIKIVFA